MVRWIAVPAGADGWRALGPVEFRVIASAGQTGGGFAMLEFKGGEGPWTVPHIHREMEESFYILDGEFVFTIDEVPTPAGAGTFLLVPRGTSHVLAAGAGGGRLLTFAVPGGLEEMFLELSELGPGAIVDPAVRAAVAARYDSHPVTGTPAAKN